MVLAQILITRYKKVSTTIKAEIFNMNIYISSNKLLSLVAPDWLPTG